MSADERVDVVDERDCVIAQATRHEVRRSNLRHRCVYILVFNPAGQMFVHQRTATKDVFPEYWDVAVGGVLLAGEEYDAAARRELAEEVGITGRPIRRLFAMRYEDAHTRLCGMVYSCTAEEVGPLQATEVARGEWWDLATLVERTQQLTFCPDGLEVLRQYLAKLESARAQRAGGR